MDSNLGGQTSDLQRQAAAKIARQKVLATYTASARKSADDNSRLKDEKINPKINSESWKKYHSAWQDYYQKYYSEYYSNAARNYVEKARLKDARQREEEREILASTSIRPQPDVSENHTIRTRIRKTAAKNLAKNRRHPKLAPIVAGLSTVFVILFLQYNRLIFAPIMAYVSPGNAPASEIEALDPTITKTISPDPKLIIPKLNINVPIRFHVPLNGIMGAMNNGVAHYRIAGADAFPGQVGNFVITGHSAGDVYSNNPYKYIFSGLERLENGDLIYVNYESTRYTFKVNKKAVIEPTNVSALAVNTDTPLITLVTCTPLGTSKYRLLVTGEQISPTPTPTTAKTPEESPAPETQPSPLPANEPSFFDSVWNWLTGR